MFEIIVKIICVYLVIINLIAILITIYDKHCAKNAKWRVPEKTLFIISFAGGSIGMYTAMLLIHHKTKKIKFMLGIPVIIILQIILFTAVCLNYGK